MVGSRCKQAWVECKHGYLGITRQRAFGRSVIEDNSQHAHTASIHATLIAMRPDGCRSKSGASQSILY